MLILILSDRPILKRFNRFFIFLVYLTLFFIAAAYFGNTFAGSEVSSKVDVELVSDVLSILPASSFWVALRLKMEEGWHIYWMNPGDSGLPPSIRWELPVGFHAGPIQWPFPKKIDTPPLVNYGYDQEVFLLTRLESPSNLKIGDQVKVVAHVKWLVCREICIPDGASFFLNLQVEETTARENEKWVDVFQNVKQKLPQVFPKVQKFARLLGNQIILSVKGQNLNNVNLKKLKFFPAEGNVIEHKASQGFKLSPNGTIQVALVKAPTFHLYQDRLKGVLLSIDGWDDESPYKVMEINVPIQKRLNFLDLTILIFIFCTVIVTVFSIFMRSLLREKK